MISLSVKHFLEVMKGSFLTETLTFFRYILRSLILLDTRRIPKIFSPYAFLVYLECAVDGVIL